MLELLVTLAIILIMVSLSLPTLNRSLMKAELRGAAKDIRSQLHEARLQAMKTGSPYLFRYQPGTNIFEILPKDEFERLQDSTSQAGTMVGPSAFGETPDETVDMFDTSVSGDFGAMPPLGEAMAEEAPADNTSDQTQTDQVLQTRAGTAYRKSLPHDIRFAMGEVSGETPADPGEDLDAVDYGAEMVSRQTVARMRSGRAKKWSDPIVFYPNGRTSSARLVLVAPPPLDSYIDITLRGLTGSARLGDMRPFPTPEENAYASYGDGFGNGYGNATGYNAGTASRWNNDAPGGPMDGYGGSLSGGSAFGGDSGYLGNQAIDPYGGGSGFPSMNPNATMDAETAFGQIPEFPQELTQENFGRSPSDDPLADHPPLGNNVFDTANVEPPAQAPPARQKARSGPDDSPSRSTAPRGQGAETPEALPPEGMTSSPGAPAASPSPETTAPEESTPSPRVNTLGIPREPW